MFLFTLLNESTSKLHKYEREKISGILSLSVCCLCMYNNN